MAEEKKSSDKFSKAPSSSKPSSRSSSYSKSTSKGTWYDIGDSIDDLLFLLLLIFLVGSLLFGFLRGDWLKSAFSQFAPTSVGPQSFDDVDTPVGGTVQLSEDTTVYSEDGTPIGTQSAGAKGTVAGGPIYRDGERYWYIDFENGPDGWVPESVLKKGDGSNFDSGDTPVGSEVRTAQDSVVYSEPGGAPAGSQSKGAKGTVTAGPKFADGERYWFVDFESGPDGWIKESDLVGADGRPFRPGSTAVGSLVVAVSDVDVLDSPGGRQIGTHKPGDTGVITDGPRWVDGKRYWYVDFENGADGWVEESQIEIVPQLTSFGRLVSGVIGFFKLLSTILSLLFLTGVIYSLVRTVQINATQHKKERSQEGESSSSDSVAVEHVNRRWERVIAHVQSENPSDWRLSILEADIMLAELLDRMGYVGENVGEKLKNIEQSDFTTLEQAWEAHKVRNLIAHQGSDYLLSQREAQRVIGLYSNVFREFRYI